MDKHVDQEFIDFLHSQTADYQIDSYDKFHQ